MEATERLVRTWIASGRDEELDNLVTDISDGQSSLLNLVKALGEYLISEEDTLRGKGVDLLSRVLERCPPETVNRQATHVLVSFYGGKVEDDETMRPALKGLVRLASLPTFTDSDAVDTYRALFTDIKMKSMDNSARYLVYQILDSLLARHRAVLRENNDEFLRGYVILVDGEKDPRNLLVAFSIDRVLCIEFDISRCVEDMFNVIFCYFPITFRPPPNDPYGITADDLRTSLRSCLKAAPAFGKLAMPLFCDKLLASSPMTKKDIIETVGACLPAYGPYVVKKHASDLWKFLKMEIFQPVNIEIEQETLRVTQIMVATVGIGESEAEHSVVDEISQECLELMSEPEKTQAIPATKVMGSLLGTSKKASELSLSKALPHIMKMVRDPGEIEHRARVLTLLCLLVADIRKELDAIISFGHQDLLLSFKDDVLSAFISGIKKVDSSEAALEGIKTLTQMDGVLTESELVYIADQVNDLLTADSEGSEVAGDEALNVLISISEKHSKIVEDHSLPLLFASLPDNPPPRNGHKERAHCWTTLRWLSRLCLQASLFETLVIRLTSKLDLIVTSPHKSEPDLHAAYIHGILRTLVSMLQLKANANHSDLPKYVESLVPKIYQVFVLMSLEDDPLNDEAVVSRLLPVAGQIVTSIVRSLPVTRQKTLAVDLRSLFLDGRLDYVNQGHRKVPLGITFSAFNVGTSRHQSNTISLLAAAVVAFHKEVLLTSAEHSKWASSLEIWSLDYADSDLQSAAVDSILASFINKNPDAFEDFITHHLDAFWIQEVISSQENISRRKRAVSTWTWITRALLVRGDNRATRFRDMLLELISDKDVGPCAAEAVGRIVNADCTVLTKSNHAVIRMLYAQKYFKATLPLIIPQLESPSEHQMAYLTALASLITHLPKAAYASEMQALMPCLIRGLDEPNTDLQRRVIDTLLSVSEWYEASTQEHANSLCMSMLRLVQSKSPVFLRIAALKYLSVLPKTVRYDKLHPQRLTVIRELNMALDDPKKAVRKEAVAAEAAWYAYKG